MAFINNHKWILVLCVITSLWMGKPSTAVAQNTTVSGTVTDASTEGTIPGVNILVKGTTTGTSTDAEGDFELNVPSMQDTLVISFIGYQTQEVPINGRASLDVALQPQAVMGEEMVVVGYGTQRREDVTSSIASIDVAEVIESKSITNISQLLQGRVPGLQVGIATTAEGQTNLQVRGVTSLTAGNDPLIVVDGVPFYGNLADLNPNSIQNIDVLKGASAAAAYGASAANGVIEVTTKQRGNTSKPSITFRASTQLATPGRVVEPYNADEYVKYKADYLRTNNPENADKFTPPNGDFKDKAFLEKIGLEPYEIQNYLNGNTINWWDQVNRERALRQKYDV